MLYPINPDRNIPWNDLPLLPIRKELYQTIEIIEKLGNKNTKVLKVTMLGFEPRIFKSKV